VCPTNPNRELGLASRSFNALRFHEIHKVPLARLERIVAQRAAKQLVPQPYLGEGETRIDFQAHLAERTRDKLSLVQFGAP